MFSAIFRRLFGSANERFVKRLRGTVEAINALEPDLEKLSDDEIRGRTAWFKGRLENGEALDDLLVEAFATVREAAKRTLGQRHFDVQMVGGIVLHRGMISEMRTGEGKTLVATLPVYLNALSGQGWMGAVYRFLGLSVGCIVHELDDVERQAAYNADITYGTNNEFGFDYLRDNMKFSFEQMVQRSFNYAIVDEVDSILIDEARTPLIISGPAEDSSELYAAIDKLIPMLAPSDFEKDEKMRAATFTETGTETLDRLLREAGLLREGGLYDLKNVSLVHHANQALRAHKLFTRDVDYLVKDDRVVIIDEFTGRMMEGRRYSEGLHQALEAKEGVSIQHENQTLASITFQNYFRLYPKLAGMTGTAMTEAGEFLEIYNLEVVDVPTNVDCVRKDADDEVYRSAREKHEAIIKLVEECRERRQPVLVGTVSIEKSELLSEMLKARKVPHKVLNARYHEQEAAIVAQAGQAGAVTIATNMAGRGTDIQLGGNADMRIRNELGGSPDPAEAQRIRDEVAAARQTVMEAGGLYIVGTERHESRRIDNQLRGRAGRQGDPGASKFFLSLEDDLMRIFGSERIDSMLQRLGIEDGEAIVHPWVNKALEKAQQKVEARNFDIRKNLLKFDDVMNDQRKVIYEQRRELMVTEDVSEEIVDMRHEVVEGMVTRCIPERAYAEQWNMDALHEEVLRVLGLDVPVHAWAKEEGIADKEIRERLKDASDRKMAEKAVTYGTDIWRQVEKSLLLQVLDQMWKDHLLTLDHLRQGIGLRAYGQRDPLNEYKREAFDLFEIMLQNLRERITGLLAHVELRDSPTEEELFGTPEREMIETREDPAFHSHASTESEVGAGAASAPLRSRQAGAGVDPKDPATWGRVSRNSACPCGSGRKYKHCHGAAG
ncbi:MAG: preprotein translocase subunit SecA [Magnetospirillum sp. WYHS-4]